jgi:uncharacterized membrane protein
MPRITGIALTSLFWILCLMIAVISLRFLTAPMAEVMDHMIHYLPAVPLPLYAHILLGPLALALAPFQLWQGLRQSRPRLHRYSGYVYVTSVTLAGAASLLMLPHFLGSPFAATGFLVMAILWVSLTLRGVFLARARDYAAHRRFMLRSVAITFGAVTLRLIMAPLIAQGWSVVETYQITAWASWLPNLIAVQLYLHMQGNRAAA